MERRIPTGFAVLGIVALILGAPFLFGEAGWLVGVPVLEGAVRLVAWTLRVVGATVWGWFVLGAGAFKSAILYWHAGIEEYASPEWQGPLRVLLWLLVVGSTLFVFVWIPYRILRKLDDGEEILPDMGDVKYFFKDRVARLGSPSRKRLPYRDE